MVRPPGRGGGEQVTGSSIDIPSRPSIFIQEDGSEIMKFRAPKTADEVLTSLQRRGKDGELIDRDGCSLLGSDSLEAGYYDFKQFNAPSTTAPTLTPVAAGQATSEEDDRLQKLLEGVQMMIERSELEARKKSHRISEANSTVFQEILSSGCVEGIENVPVLFDAKKHKTRNVPEFEWNDAVESGQAARYVKYVEEYLVQSEKEKEWSVINGNKHPKLLNGILKGNREGTEFRGTTDVVVVQRGAEGLPQTGLKILFELKKVGTISGHAEYQTIFSLLLANTICRHLRPIAVLTDLVDKWVLYYCDRSIVYRHTFSSRSEAVGYLDAILEDDTDPEAVSHDTRHGTPALRSPGESSSRGVKRSFSGRRIFSIPALEQLEELAGFLPEDELRQGRAAIALQCALNIPAFYSVVSDLREAPEGIQLSACEVDR